MQAPACGLIIVADNAFFGNPFVREGIRGLGYFAHLWQMSPGLPENPCVLGRTHQPRGPVNSARSIACAIRTPRRRPRLRSTDRPYGPLWVGLGKKAVNICEDGMGLRDGIDAVFGSHHLAHSHNVEIGADSLGGHDDRTVRSLNQQQIVSFSCLFQFRAGCGDLAIPLSPPSSSLPRFWCLR